jgi:hypothetical protein
MPVGLAERGWGGRILWRFPWMMLPPDVLFPRPIRRFWHGICGNWSAQAYNASMEITIKLPDDLAEHKNPGREPSRLWSRKGTAREHSPIIRRANC